MKVRNRTTRLKEKRKHERRQFLKPIRYYLPAPHLEQSRKIYSYGNSVDISKGGLGMITDYPLLTGNVLFFLDTVTVDNVVAKSAIVRWTSQTENHRYRVGLEFRRRNRVSKEQPMIY